MNLIGTFNVLSLGAAKMAENEPDEEGTRGVSDGPGAIVTTRIPFEARSRATGSVIPATPALDAE